jgi:hypothetical protein
MTQAALVVLTALLACQQVVSQPRDFLRKVSIREVEADLQATLSGLLGGKSAVGALRLEDIEASVWQTFQALPKNAVGRLAPSAVRYIVHGYFAREHGWLIKGLEPHGMQVNVSQIHEVSILQDKAPALVEGLLEARQSDRGLALHDIVQMIAVLEQMMFDESVTLLEAAYRLHQLPVEDSIDSYELFQVLRSYIVLFETGARAELFDIHGHEALMRTASEDSSSLSSDTIMSFQFKHRHRINPFKPCLYSFQSATEVMRSLALQHGKWQDADCREMKAALTDLDPQGYGAVPLSVFYAQPEGRLWHFQESEDYLRTIGALDESTSDNPQVFITNYVYGASNCIASSSYYSVCCISECDHLMTELEHHVSAPVASPEKILDYIGNLTEDDLRPGLAEKLDAIAARNEGVVPVHGRLFAQWLHFAFPHECPYPSVIESATALTASQWVSTDVVSAEDLEQHVASASAQADISAKGLDIEARWSDHEFLPVDAPPSALFVSTGSIRVVAQIFVVAATLRSALAVWRGAGEYAQKKHDDCALYV